MTESAPVEGFVSSATGGHHEPSPASRPSVADLLREATREEHAQAESIIRLPQSVDDLVHQLEHFYGYLHPWEHCVAITLLKHTPGLWAGRARVACLDLDLLALGHAPDHIAHLPHCRNLPNLSTLARCLGSMYVMEGSRLGGQIISAHIERRIGLANGLGYSFFRGWGSETMPRWRAFKAGLEESMPRDELPDAIDAARETFRTLTAWFDE